MRTVHLIYPHGTSISCPDAIGRNVAARLRERYQVRLYDITSLDDIRPGADDVLLGHPHQMPWTCLQRSIRHKGWRRIIVMSPYTHEEAQVAFLDPFVRRADRYLSITGRYWFSSIASSPFAHWLPKMTHLDLAIDRTDFPHVKRTFSPPGKRRFLYIGGTLWYKNPNYLSEIALALKDTAIDWIGPGRSPLPGLTARGFVDFSTERAKQMIAEYDFLLTVGRADANPTTILEAMAWGLIPVCTPQSGYSGYESIPNVPLDDVQGAGAILRGLQTCPEDTLLAWQQQNHKALDSHFTWDRFTQQVLDAIESTDSPSLTLPSLPQRLSLRWKAMRSPYSPYRPLNLARFVRASMRRKSKA